MTNFDPVVTKILDELMTMAIEEIKQEVALVAGVKDEIEKLRLNLNAIRAVLAEAELKGLKKDATTAKAWLDELKKAAYHIEDVLDKWDTAMMIKSLAEKGDHSPPVPAASKLKRKVCKCSFLPSCCFGVSEVGLRHDIGSKIKTLNEKLDSIAGRKDRYHLDSVADTGEVVEYRKTTSVINVTEVKGREKDKNVLINMLLSESSETQVPLTISLVGVGGLGKTTLAKLTYNDEKVEAHFNKRIWVCVSDPFDEIKIAKAILESLEDDNSNFGGLELETLVNKIGQSIEGNKFLLVLDDVWNKEPGKWEQLQCSLMRGAPGSRILVTTRNVEVAEIMGSIESSIFQIGLLSKEECWSIFNLQAAFSKRTNRERKQLEDIGWKIVEKCKGLPLAAKTLGGLLRFKKSKEEWERVLNSELWQLEEVEIERDLFAPLCLSYYDLSLPLRQCFSYCAIFPKDHKILIDELIELWMAQGLLRVMPNKDIEMLGEEYFQYLSVRSFFQDFEEDEVYGRMIRSCKMHDIVHDFAQFLSKDECFSMEIHELEDSSKQFVNKEALHLCIAVGIDQDTLRSFVCNFEKLRSLFIYSSRQELLLTDDDTLLKGLICLRSLNLSGCDITKVPSSIARLIHLRYLNLSSNERLERLPEAVCDLINLQTLNLCYCRHLEGLPQGIEKLINLRHLSNGTFCPYFLPKGIGRLSCLRKLEWFNVGSSSEEMASLRDLKNLKYLRGSLVITGLRYVIDVEDAKQAQLKQMDRITSLTLFFGDFLAPSMVSEKERELIEALEPSPNLESLSVWNYDGPAVLPSWMESLPNLRRLQFNGCSNWQYLPPLGKLSSLEHLDLYFISEVKKVGNEFLGVMENNEKVSSRTVVFPKLNALTFCMLTEWEEWDMVGMNFNNNMLTIMPCIRQLTMQSCWCLKKLPDHLRHLTTLHRLSIKDCPILEERCKKQIGEDWHKISHIPNIQINGKYVQKEGKPTGT